MRAVPNLKFLLRTELLFYIDLLFHKELPLNIELLLHIKLLFHKEIPLHIELLLHIESLFYISMKSDPGFSSSM